MKTPALLEPEEIIAAEYEYIAQTAFQAHEDRARVSTFYLVSVGSLFGAIWGTSPNTENLTLWIFAALFLFLSFFGVLTIKQLVRLRLAWFESAKAMNQIKKYLIQENEKLNKAFRWKKETLPAPYKPKSISYYLALQVAMIGSVTFSAMLFYVLLALKTTISPQEILHLSPDLLIWALFGGGIFLYLQMRHYRKGLTKDSNT